IGGRNQQPRGAKLYPASASSLAISEGCLAWAEGVILRFISHSLLLGILSLLLFSLCDKTSDVKKSQGGGRMKLRKHFRCLALLVLCLGCAQFALAQGTDLGTIRGLVTDPSGAVIPNAKVIILDLGTNTTRETATNARGEYQMFGLRSGSYKVSISAPGLTTQDITGVVLNGSDVVSANATLRVAGTQEAVVVTAEAPTINTENQTISDTITNQAVIDLPRDSRDVYSFLYLNPNITQGVSSGEFKVLGAQSYGASFSVDGQRSSGG